MVGSFRSRAELEFKPREYAARASAYSIPATVSPLTTLQVTLSTSGLFVDVVWYRGLHRYLTSPHSEQTLTLR